MRIWATLLLVPALALLAGCSVSEEEIAEEVGGLPGVVEATGSCAELSCEVEVRADRAATATEVARMITAAAGVEHAREVRLQMVTGEDDPYVSAKFDVDEVSAEGALATGGLLVWGSRTPGIDSLAVSVATRGSVEISVRKDGSVWALSRRAWELAAPLPGAALTLTRGGPNEQQLHVEDEFPEEPVAAIEEFAGRHVDDALTGVVLAAPRLTVGGIDQRAARELRAELAADPRTAGLSINGVATTEVIAAARREVGTLKLLDPVIEILEQQPGVQSVRLEPKGLAVEVPDFDAARSALTALRADRPRWGDTSLLFRVPAAEQQVEITEDGDDAVLDLALAVLDKRPAAHLDIRQDTDAERGAVYLGLIAPAPEPATGSAPSSRRDVRLVSDLVIGTPGTAPTYRLGVTTRDADGREETAGWDVARDGWALTQVRGVPARQAMVTEV